MTYIGRDLADEDDIEEINKKITAILDILFIKGIINKGVDHYDVYDLRDEIYSHYKKENE